MKNTSLVIFLLAIIAGCSISGKKPDPMSFNNRYGILYFSFPSEGQTITGVFLPYANEAQRTDTSLSIFNLKLKTGIKFSTPSLALFDELSKVSKQTIYSTNDRSGKIFWIPHVKIYYHITKPMYDAESVLDDKLKVDTLLAGGKYYYAKYLFSHVTIEDIKLN